MSPAQPVRPLRLLLVEDSEDDAALLRAELRRGGFGLEDERVQTEEAMRDALARRAWDVILSDYSMPAFSGAAALAVRDGLGLDVPLIMVSGTLGEDAAVEALKAGAADFVVKDRLARLVPAIERELQKTDERRRRRQVEQALTDLRSRMQLTLEAVGVGIADLDLATGRLLWTPEYARLHGEEPENLESTLEARLEAVHPADRDAVRQTIDRAVRAREDAAVEYRVTWPGGSVHWIRLLGRALSDETGQPVRAVGIGVDITAQKSLEAQFLQAQKMEAIGQLASGIAHDFNNLLTVIIGMADLLQETVEPGTIIADDVREIRRAGEKAASLTRQLLAFSRQQILEPRVLQLNDVLGEMQGLLRRLLGEDIDLRFTAGPGLHRVLADQGQISQVITNLAVNARDAMPHGGRLSIETANVDVDEDYGPAHGVPVTPGPYVMMAVTDSGEGMDAATRARIFEPFFTTKAQGKGTGLGLSTVYGIVKQSRGFIWVYSELGTGTSFKIYLPAVFEGRPADRPLAAPTATRGTETILLVEDSEPLRALATRFLETAGYTVLAAASAEDALARLEDPALVVHLLVTDVVMPGLSGRDLAERVERTRAQTRVLYMSGYTADTMVLHRVFEGQVPLLHKPFTAEELRRKVRTVLDAP